MTHRPVIRRRRCTKFAMRRVPMVYLIKRYLAKPLAKIGGLVGLSSDATAGLLAASANVLAVKKTKELEAADESALPAEAVPAKQEA